MADNAQKYGFRWSTKTNGTNAPHGITGLVATGQVFTVSAVNYDLNVGDPVRVESTGMFNIALAGETIFGVCVGFAPYYDGSVMKVNNKLPSGIAYSTNLERQTKIYVVPAHWGIWEVDCDDATTATTLAAYQALIGENADLAHSGSATTNRINPRLDISDHKTATAQWRILGISGDAANQDFSGNYVKLQVVINETQFGPAFTGTGI